MSSWMDDVSLKSSSGGGSYIDPRTGRKYAFRSYVRRGKKKLLSGRRKKYYEKDIIDITDADDAFENYIDDVNAGRARYRGKRGRDAYGGPGKVVRMSGGRRKRLGLLFSKRGEEAKQENAFIDYLKNTANWWDTERASGQRGQERRQMLESQKEGLEIMRAEAAEGRGWGRTQAAK